MANDLKEQGRTLAASQAALKTQQGELAALKGALIAREAAVVGREADADAGFITRSEASLANLKAVHDAVLKRTHALTAEHDTALKTHAMALTERSAAHLETLAEREQAHAARLEAELKASTAEMEEKAKTAAADMESKAKTVAENLALNQKNLQGREASLREREAAIKTDSLNAAWAQEDADALKADVQAHIEARAEQLRADLEVDMSLERSRVERYEERTRALESKLEEFRDAERAVSHEGPAAMKKRLEGQAAKISELMDELANRPNAAEAEDLDGLRKEQAQWANQRRTLQLELAQVRHQLVSHEIGVDEVELLRDRNAALKTNQQLLEAALDDLRADVDERLNKDRGQPAFPELMRMDGDSKAQTAPTAFFGLDRDGLDLEAFARDLRHRIGRSDDPDEPDLYYGMAEIRALLGGLAMSHLHLLQGISGIGKSSLPRRFAAAVGGLCETVSVQAGWRDRNDLLGHYNSFEKRYTESGFVQALYKAQTPQFRDRIVIVLLDEMNLSHPEQYAADVLDVLERKDKGKRRFRLMDFQPLGASPRALVDGRFLPLPPNVWFVGTANHDETTKDFADKTYDRSFVQVLPSRPDRSVKLEAQSPQSPVHLAALRKAFTKAESTYRADVKSATEWMDKTLAPFMSTRFKIGFGGRLFNQAGTFISVVLASGGTLGEAMDQLISTRILRKLQGRYDLMEKDLQATQTLFETEWIDGDTVPIASLTIIETELKRVGAGV